MPLWKYQCWRCNLWISLIHWLTVTQYHKVLTSVYISILNLKIWTTYTCSHSPIDHRFFVLVSPRSLKFGMQPLLWCYRWEKMKDFSKLPTGTPAADKKLKREFFFQFYVTKIYSNYEYKCYRSTKCCDSASLL